MLLILSFNTIPLFVSWLTTAYNYPIITTYEFILAILVSPTNFKVVAIVGVALGSILFNKLFLPFTVTGVVIILYNEVFSTYISI
jgi:TctA family transporter